MRETETGALRSVLDRQSVISILLISLLLSFLSLSIPIAAQTLINLIAFGKLLQPVLSLSFIVLILMLAIGALNVWQSLLIEVVQQKLMVKISLNLSKQFTHLSLENFSAHHGPALVNRFFEVATINKAFSSLLLYGTNLGLQLLFGLILLTLYHPFFLIFNGCLLLGIFLIIYLPFKKAKLSADKECSYKHAIGAWFEEILANRRLFRFNRYPDYATAETDRRLVRFLKARNSHFSQLIRHQFGFYMLSALASSGLLGLGGYLVIHNQLSLGQLVAAEIVLGSLIYAFKRFGSLLENYYDLAASLGKIDSILDLPSEVLPAENQTLFYPIQNIQIEINTLVGEATIGTALLIGINEAGIGRNIAESLFGFSDTPGIKLLINGNSCPEVNRRSLRQHAALIRGQEWFAGTILANLRLNQNPLVFEELQQQLSHFGLLDKIMQHPEGLQQIVYDWQTVFTELELIKLMLVRAWLAKPNLLVIDQAFDKFSSLDRNNLLEACLDFKQCLCILISQYPEELSWDNRLLLS